MNGLFLHTGNRLETLADELATVARDPLENPLTPEVVIVQSQGMRRWLSLQLADRLGVCLNFQFPFPHTLLDEALRAAVPDLAPREEFDPALLAWRIHELLPSLLEEPEFEPVRHYVADGDAMKLYQLATRFARLFDQYLVYRPEMILDWEASGPGSKGRSPKGEPLPLFDAQAMLWRKLNPERRIHFAAALRRISQGLPREGLFPERISIFGISSLPPAQMQVFLQLAEVRPVHLFMMAPSREYHGDDMTAKQRARRGLRGQGGGNPLLTSLGKLNARFTSVLLESDERAGHRAVDLPETFIEPGTDSLLHTIQADVLLARNRGTGLDEFGAEPFTVTADDASVQLHVCHSPMREVEVLYDQLVDLFAHDRSLKPRDILVMTPNIEQYAPLIHAVFGCPENPALRIPYSVADRAPKSDSPIVGTFLALLDLPGTRRTAPQVFALLQMPPFRRRFNFDDNDLERIRGWIDETGIRWGNDEAHRAELGLADFTENTWRHGIDRLLLGYAMVGGNRNTFEEVLPQDDVEGEPAELAGRFAEAVNALFDAINALNQPRALADWPDALQTVVNTFFTASGDSLLEEGRDHRETQSAADREDALGLWNAVERLRAIARKVGPGQPVDFVAVREFMIEALGEAEQRGGFLTGGITFCALKPMRSIPARVIWLMGMNDGAFPRHAQPLRFDLIAAAPIPGDRSVRDDDRYLFLEALASARDRLCMSHVGRSLVSRDKFPPSVVVSELLDYLDQSCVFPENRSARESLVVLHRLHGFSRRYFEPGGRLFSYSAANCAAAAVRALTAEEPIFLERPLAPPEPQSAAVELAGLLSFFDNPSAFFLRERLAIRLSRGESAMAESEPMSVEHLTRYQVRRELLERKVAEEAFPDKNVFTSRALLPVGSVGEQHFAAMRRDISTLFDRVIALLGTTARDPAFPLDLRIGEFTLSGRLDALYSGRLAFFRPADIKAKDRIRAWIQHLAWCSADAATPPATLLVGQNEAIQFPPLPREESILRLMELIAIYQQGWCKPLSFFPESSWEYARNIDATVPLEKARAKWRGGFNFSGEMDDPAYHLCFGECDPLDEQFEKLAIAVFGAMNAETLPSQTFANRSSSPPNEKPYPSR